MNGGHDTTFDADGVVQHLGKRGEAVGGARTIRDHLVDRQQVIVVHAEDNGLLDVFGRSRDQNLLGAAFQMDFSLLAVVELAGAFQNDVAAGPVQFRRVIGREHFHRALADVHGVPVDNDVITETTVDTVVAQQVGAGLERASRVHLNHFHVFARCFSDMSQRAAADTAKSVDAKSNSHATPHLPLWCPYMLRFL